MGNTDSVLGLQRRQLIKGALAVSAGMAGFSVLKPVYAADDMVVKGPRVPDVKPSKVSARCHVIIAKDPEPTPENQGMFSNMGFIITQKGVVVFDSGGSVQIGEMLIRQIKKMTDKPVVKVFNSHMHGDHWLGNHAFVQEWPNVEIYAHENMHKAIKEGVGEFWVNMQARATNNATAGTVITAPNQVLKGGEVFDMGDTLLRVHYYGKCHTDSDICLEVTADKTVYAGDIVMTGRVANMDDGTYTGSIEGIKKLKADTQATNYVQGHFKFGPKQADIYLEFLETLYGSVVEFQKQGVGPSEMKDKVLPKLKKYRDWKGFDGVIGRYIALAYTEAEANNF
ncbi:MAG: MBL fold metallo-hydrolase [Gammaproteobacteria bacterium]|nr:MBL fold metallo-hydrolase [Gammaproteobacteria bacterium]